jgi:lipopolysaccharide/colanic/teichoic acid biosynthesis glycosyltransferase
MSLSSPATTASLPPALQPAAPTAAAGVMDRREVSALWSDPVHRLGKRVIDLAGAGLGLLLLSPLMLVVAAIIRLTSSGPVMFRQTRLGKDGKPFQIFKFRTMLPDAEARLKDLEHLNESEGGVLFKIKRDPRVTWIGRILRKTSLDELPQLINILRGEMSLVGPRPLQLRDSHLLAQVDPKGYAYRLEVLPGLTGYWQVKGRSETGFDHMLQMDLEYIRMWNLGLDLNIIIQTAFGVLKCKGAC